MSCPLEKYDLLSRSFYYPEIFQKVLLSVIHWRIITYIFLSLPNKTYEEISLFVVYLLFSSAFSLLYLLSKLERVIMVFLFLHYDICSRYTNADLKIYQYLRLHMKIIGWKFHIKHLLVFEICARDIREKCVYKHWETIEYVKN